MNGTPPDKPRAEAGFTVKEVTFIAGAVHEKSYPPAGPPEIAFAGRSNVGKSSLINKIINRRNLVRVSKRPGRTQEINFFAVNNDEIRFVDLPGYGFAKVPEKVRAQWGQMIEHYILSRATLAAVVVILDVRREPSPEDRMLLDWLKANHIPMIVAVTKADKLSRNKGAARLAKLKPLLTPFDPAAQLFSAATGQGKRQLLQRIWDAAADLTESGR